MNKWLAFFLVALNFLLHPEIIFSQNGDKRFEFDDFFKNYTFYSRAPRPGRSLNDGVHYLMTEKGTRLIEYSYETGEKTKVFFDLSTVPECPVKSFSDYTLSPDETKILLLIDRESIYRRSFTANYYIFDCGTNTIKPLSANGKQQLATFSPDGTKVAFVRSNDLFYCDLLSGKEVRVTYDGKPNAIINGVPDWVYEEEFEFNKAFEWSPDGNYLAWIRFDESKVHEFSMTLFQGAEPSLDENKTYPGVTTFKYPKAGEGNSLVTVHTYNLKSRKKKLMDIGPETDIYIPRIRWTRDPGKLAIFRMNRHQNNLRILLADPAKGISRLVYDETNKYYIDEKYLDKIEFLPDREHFSIISERDGWAHVYLFNMDGSMFRQITKGHFDVTDLNGIDTENQCVYYTSAEPTPYQRSVYKVKWDGSAKTLLSDKTGTNSATFSKGFKYFTLSWSNAKTPTQLRVFRSDGTYVRTIDENKALTDKLKDYKFNTKEFFSFTTSDQVQLNGWMVRPPDFKSSEKYPVLMTQYSGPNSQSTIDRWELDWEDYIASMGYIIVCVDGRGTGGRGEEFRKLTYLQLGKYETIDQVETAKYLGTLPFVDKERIGIWGWSFGGYISSSCMVKGEGVFKAAIAVAPVTNWRYYDNIYTERFMRTPQENPDGYDQNSPIFFADKLQGKLLLCHGTADDNVHVQNTMEFSEKLVQANKQFEMQLYTNRDHGIYGGNTTYHLYTRMTEFLLKNL